MAEDQYAERARTIAALQAQLDAIEESNRTLRERLDAETRLIQEARKRKPPEPPDTAE